MSALITDKMNMGKTGKCDPREIALKSFFLGPQAENAPWVSTLLHAIFERWVGWRRSFFTQDGHAITENDQNSPEFQARRDQFEETALELVARFESEVPKFSPRYVGHMFSEISLPALIGHIVTLLHNPNNISGETSRVGIQIEEEATRALLAMVGFPEESATGHFVSGGTIANLEALTRAYSRYSLWLSADAALKATDGTRSFDPFLSAHSGWSKFNETLIAYKDAKTPQKEMERWNFSLCNPFVLAGKIESLTGRKFLGPVMLVPDNMHYSWKKGCHLLGLGADALWTIQLDSHGRLSIPHLKDLLEQAIAEGRPVLLVVSVLGTTELGGMDPVEEVQDALDALKTTHGIHVWHHVDAAYGGLFRTLDLNHTESLSKESLRSLQAVPRTNSVTLDPHKLGYVPYASGTFLARDKMDYYFTTFEDAPYIDFNKARDRGPYTIEGSRSAAGAVATWMTAETMGLRPDGYGLLLERTIRIRRKLGERIKGAKLPIQLAPGCDTNILCFACAKSGESTSASNERSLRVYDAFSPKNNGPFIVSKTALRWKSYTTYLDRWVSEWSGTCDTDELVLIRMCLMNPFFDSSEMDVNYAETFIESLRSVFSENRKTTAGK